MVVDSIVVVTVAWVMKLLYAVLTNYSQSCKVGLVPEKQTSDVSALSFTTPLYNKVVVIVVGMSVTYVHLLLSLQCFSVLDSL